MWVQEKKEEKEKERKKRKRKEKKKKGNLDILQPQYNSEAVLSNIFENGSSSIREAAPPEEPEPELFSEEPEPRQTGPYPKSKFF